MPNSWQEFVSKLAERRTIEVGMVTDLLILQAKTMGDISNTLSFRWVIKGCSRPEAEVHSD